MSSSFTLTVTIGVPSFFIEATVLIDLSVTEFSTFVPSTEIILATIPSAGEVIIGD